jgi:hypothetical protein
MEICGLRDVGDVLCEWHITLFYVSEHKKEKSFYRAELQSCILHTTIFFSPKKIYLVFDYFGELLEISANWTCVHPVFGPPFTP